MRRFFLPVLVLCLAFQVLHSAGAIASPNSGLAPVPYASEWRTTGPSGGDVRALVVDPNDPDRFYFGTLDGQIYMSADGARNWRLLVNFNRPQLFVDHIIVDPRDSRTLYVATHRHKEPGGFFKSTNGGLTWREAPALKGEALHSMTQSARNPDLILVGTNRGIYRSLNAGDTWTFLATTSGTGLINVESLAIDPRDADVIYAGTWYLPYKSTDGGRTWRSIKAGIIDDSDIFAIDIDPRDANHVIASACSGIYETRNAGENWSKVEGIPSQSRRTRAILQHPSVPGIVFAGTTEGFWRSASGGAKNSWMVTTSRLLEINSIAVHPRNPEKVFIGTNNYGVMVSHDGGKSFAPSNGGYSGRFTNFILPDRENPNRVYATTINTATGGGFFFVSNDAGMTWQPSMRNMPPRLTSSSILQDERDANTIYLGTNLGVYRSIDRGASWAPIKSVTPSKPKPKRPARRGPTRPAAARTPTPARTALAAPATTRLDDLVKRAQAALNVAGYDVGKPDGHTGPRTVAAIRKFQSDRNLPVSGRLDEATMGALGLGGRIQGSTVSGKLPTPVQSLIESINALAHCTDHENGRLGILAATNAGLFRSYNPAGGWERISYGPGLDSRTTAISTNPQNPRTIWVGTATSGVLVSRDGGETWRQIPGIPPAPVNVIVQDRQRSAYIYVGTKQAFYSSHDGGERWVRRGGNLPYGDFTSILLNPRDGNEIFVGNAYQNGEIGGGVYRSADAGLTWSRIDPRLPSQRIWALAFDIRNPSTLFVGSHSAGVYVVPRSGESISGSIP